MNCKARQSWSLFLASQSAGNEIINQAFSPGPQNIVAFGLIQPVPFGEEAHVCEQLA